MVLKAVHVSDALNHRDLVQEHATLSTSPSSFTKGSTDVLVEDVDPRLSCKFPNKKFMIMGHRGSGVNILQSSNPRMKDIRENTITSFNEAAKLDIDFIEFDVQVTKDGCPVIFHDIFIHSEQKGAMIKERVTDLTLEQFQSYGPPQETSSEAGKPLFRMTNDGKMLRWNVEVDDHLCTLEEVFQKVNNHSSLGFNIELKFDDKVTYKEDVLTHLLQLVIQVVIKYAKDKPIIFSSFHPDAAVLMKKLQTFYPVFLITKGGTEIFTDIRRNSMEEAMKVCLAGSLNGIVSDVKAIIRHPEMVLKIKDSKLLLLTYGQLNNLPEVVYVQKFWGIEGVIVDIIEDITDAISDLNETVAEETQEQFFSVLKKISQINGILK